VEKYIRNLESKKGNCDSWLDITDLIAFNQKLRMRRYVDDVIL
jgi:hypothetical protein